MLSVYIERDIGKGVISRQNLVDILKSKSDDDQRHPFVDYFMKHIEVLRTLFKNFEAKYKTSRLNFEKFRKDGVKLIDIYISILVNSIV